MTYALTWRDHNNPCVDQILWKTYDSPWGRLVLWVWRDQLIRVFREDYPWTRVSFSAADAVFEAHADVDVFFEAMMHPTSQPQKALAMGTSFELKVWKALVRHGDHANLTYGDLASLAGSPLAARAVGAALSRNPLPLIIPCHRVVAQTHGGGFQWGMDEKKRLQDHPPCVSIIG